MTPVQNYRKWLKAVVAHYGIEESDITVHKQSGHKSTRILKAKYTFFLLCIKDGINLYELSLALGKDRSSIMGAVSMYLNKYAERKVAYQIREKSLLNIRVERLRLKRTT